MANHLPRPGGWGERHSKMTSSPVLVPRPLTRNSSKAARHSPSALVYRSMGYQSRRGAGSFVENLTIGSHTTFPIYSSLP